MKIQQIVASGASIVIAAVAAASVWAVGSSSLQGSAAMLGDSAPVANATLHAAAHRAAQYAVCPPASGYSGSTMLAAVSTHKEAPGASIERGGSATALKKAGSAALGRLDDTKGGTVSAKPVGGDPSEPLGIVSGFSKDDEKRGLVAGACSMPSRSAWFVGATGRVGHVSVLTLANPFKTASKVTIAAWDATGPLYQSNTDIVVGAGETKKVRLDGIYPASKRLALHVQASGQGAAMSLFTYGMEGLSPQGASFVEPAVEPAKNIAVPAVNIGKEYSFVRIANPSKKAAKVSISLASQSGMSKLKGAADMTIAASSVADVSLMGVKEGIYGLSISSSQPVTAAAYSGTSPSGGNGSAQEDDWESDKPRTIGSDYDMAWIPAQPLRTAGVIVIPDGASVDLSAVARQKTSISLRQLADASSKASDARQTLKEFEGEQHGSVQAGVWEWTSKAPVALGGIARSQAKDGIAFVKGFSSAQVAGRVAVQIYP